VTSWWWRIFIEIVWSNVLTIYMHLMWRICWFIKRKFESLCLGVEYVPFLSFCLVTRRYSAVSLNTGGRHFLAACLNRRRVCHNSGVLVFVRYNYISVYILKLLRNRSIIYRADLLGKKKCNRPLSVQSSWSKLRHVLPSLCYVKASLTSPLPSLIPLYL
jgi:hypothetical protein